MKTHYIILAVISTAAWRISAAPPVLGPLPAEVAKLSAAALLPARPEEAFTFRDRSTTGTPATVLTAEVSGVGTVMRATNPNPGQKHFFAEISWKTTSPVKKGDVCLARFSARTLSARQESGEGAVNFYFQRAAEPFDRSVQLQFAPNREWANFEIPFVAHADFALGEAMTGFSFGHLVQAFELTNVEVINFHRGATLDELPRTRFSYAGREPGAPWRAAALARIEKVRTAPLSIRVVDSTGHPLDAEVEATLEQPDFIFGTAVSASKILSPETEDERYRDKILELFTGVTIDNALKWRAWDNAPEQRDATLRAVDWIDRHRLRLRGHNLVWPGWNFSPKGLKETSNLPEHLPRLIGAHIRSVMNATSGKVYGWDVLNEVIHEKDYFKYIPESSVVDWFKLARTLDPRAHLYINDYEVLVGANSPDVISTYRGFIDRFRQAGAPIDGIGLQAHIGQQVRDPEKVLADLDLLAVEGLPLQITEFDIDTNDEQLQADYTRDFLIACYSHPAVEGFTMWGFWEPAHWKPLAAMLRPDFSEKPNARVWRDLVLNTWRTHVQSRTDPQGTMTTRGHLGQYTITVKHGAEIHRQTIFLGKTGADVMVTFP